MNTTTFKVYALLLCLFMTYNGNAQKQSKLTKVNPKSNIFVKKQIPNVSASGAIESHKRTPIIDLGQYKNQKKTDLSIINRGLSLSSDYTFVDSKKAIVKDRSGKTHQRYAQYYNGIPVLWGEMTLHREQSGVPSKMNGEYYEIKNVSINPTLSVTNIVLKSKLNGIVGYNDFNFNYNEADGKPTAKLVLVPNLEADLKIKNMPTANLAYEMIVFASSPTRVDKVYLDAHTGILLYKYPLMMHADRFERIEKEMGINLEELADHNKCIAENRRENYKENTTNYSMVAGTGETRYSGTRTIDTEVSGATNRLWDVSRNIKTFDVEGRDFNNGWVTYADIRAENKDFFDVDNIWTQAEHNGPGDDDDYNAFDAHWATMMIMDFWDTTFSWDSWDGAGGETRNHIHRGTNLDNAGFLADGEVAGIGYMSYGNGNNFTPLVSLDVAGHEVGHGTTNATSGLAYQNQSGALNEGFSDIWGVVIENYGNNNAGLTKDISLVGEEIINGYNGWPALRSMVSPKDCGQPDTYLGTNWITTGDEGACVPDGNTNDYCGVHTNSGVLNHWFYLLFSGGVGTNDNGDAYNVSAITIEKAAAIAWRTNSVYLGANSTYADARTSSITAAADLYGNCSPEEAAVTNAWYAVGVGAAFVNSCVPEIAFSTPLGNIGEGSDCNYIDVNIPVTIAIAASADATATFSITGGTSSNTLDYDLLTPSVTFPAGTTTAQNMVLRIYNDSFVEADETITMDFSINANGGDAVLGANTLTYTINNDDYAFSSTETVTLVNSNFETGDTTTWTNIDNDGNAANDWQGFQGLTYTGIDSSFPGSLSNNVLGNGANYSPDNFYYTGPITIPSDATSVNFNYGIGGYLDSEPYEVYWAETATPNVANITGGQLIDSGNTLSSEGEIKNIDLVTIAGQEGYFAVRHLSQGNGPARTDGVLLLDNVSITATIPVLVQTVMNVGTTDDQININDSGSIYSADTSKAVMLDITSNNTFNYGCTDVSVSRAGTSAQSYNASTGANHVMDKVFTIAPTNTTTSGNNNITFYFTEAEVSGWEAATGLSRNDLSALRTTNYETVSLTLGTFGTNVTLTGNFTGLDGEFYFGHPDAFKVLISPKVFLQGAAINPNTGEESLMRDDLRVKGLIPTTSPYPADAATCNASVFSTTGANAIVDWMLIELRDATTNTSIISSKSALLQRDGDIVGVDGTSAVEFHHPGKDYHIVIKHRNHMGIMTDVVSALTSTVSVADFSNAVSSSAFGTNSQSTYGMPTNVIGMWAGNADDGTTLRYLGADNDSNRIKDIVLADGGNTSNSNLYAFDAYNTADVNLDGTIRYQGANNDVNIIKDVILSNVSNTGSSPNLYVFTEQLPEN